MALKQLPSFFERHVKTRIALQLVLDGLPFVLGLSRVLFYMAGNDMISLSRWMGYLVVGGMFIFYFVSIPLTFLSLWLRCRMDERKERRKLVLCTSTTFEVLSIMMTVISLPMTIPFTMAVISSLFNV